MPRTITKTVYTFKELLELANDPEATGNMRQMRKNAVDKAKEWLRDVNTRDEWWEYTYETWKDALDQIGFTDADISFHGFCSQGDGASFTSRIDVDRIVDFFTTDIKPKDCIEPVPMKYSDQCTVNPPCRDRSDHICNLCKACHDKLKIFGHNEDFRPWIVEKVGGKITNPKYRFVKWVANTGYFSVSVDRISHQYSHWATCRVEINWSSNTKPRTEQLLCDFRDDLERLRKDLSQTIYSALEAEYEHLCSDEQLAELAEANDYTFTVDGRREG